MRGAHFGFSNNWLPLNHGSYGTWPNYVRDANKEFRAQCESQPDWFIRSFAGRLTPNRKLVADILNAPVDDIVLVPNVTTGIDTVFKNLVWQPGDVILGYELVYGAVYLGAAWLQEYRGVELETVPLQWPASDDEIVQACGDAIRKINREGQGKRRVKLAICDTIISMPGIRVPYGRLVAEFQKEGALVLLDGAHGIGQIDIDLEKTQPDFFVTNLHKWLYVPRGCAAFYVQPKHQHLIRTGLPTSIGYKPRPKDGEKEVKLLAPRPESTNSPFVEIFDYTGTLDSTHYLCVEAALKFRNEACGGESAIRSYNNSLAREAGDRIAEKLGTEVMDHPGSNMRDCHFANIRLPLEIGNEPGQVKPEHTGLIEGWLKEKGATEYGTYHQTFLYHGTWWWRISGQIYVELDDFPKGTDILLELLERIKKGEHVPPNES